jgi:hypothetical protein
MKKPLLTAQFNIFINGGKKLLGVADCVFPNMEAITETVTGAGIMGELEVPSTGQFSAMRFTMNFRSLIGEPDELVVGKPYHFDARTAQSFEDTTTYDQGITPERLSVMGPIMVINQGNRAPNSPWDATIEVSIRRMEKYVNGQLKISYDIHNGIYSVGGNDIYSQVRAAVS